MSYTGHSVLDMTFTLKAGQSDLTGHQAVIMDTAPTNPDDMTVKYPTANAPADTYPAGIAQVDEGQAIVAGKQVTVRVRGISKAIAAAAINPGSLVRPTSNGMLTSAAPSTTEWWTGVAYTKAAALGDEFLVLVAPELKEA